MLVATPLFGFGLKRGGYHVYLPSLLRNATLALLFPNNFDLP